ncbi:MAG TPA: CCA tRNA nucleotidyltransferase [Clostridiales bacterium]|nr:CCA tRNA nucleotidyltransferase [Clostridiales bacterium]
MKIPAAFKKWAKSLHFSLYITGGCVRDYIQNNRSYDIDAVGAVPSKQIADFLPLDAKFEIVNPKLDTSVIIMDGVKIEYAPFRTEQYKAGEHTPYLSNFIDDPKIDSLRRDFTCNALYYDIKQDKILDFHNGIQDINNKILRAISSPDQVFCHDGLRILRMVRFAAELGYQIDPSTYQSALKHKNNLKDISKERIRQEFDKILIADAKCGIQDAQVRGLRLIAEMALWEYIIPEMRHCVGFEQKTKHHKYDVYEHLLETVRLAPPNIRLEALLHDIGKPFSQIKYGSMSRHSDIGVEIIKKRLGQKGLKYPNHIVDKTVRMIEAHMFDLKQQASPFKMRKFVVKNYDILDDFIQLVRADTLAHGTDKPDRSLRFLEAKKELERLNLPKSIKELNINGNDIKNAYPDLPPKYIGEILDKLLDACLKETIKNQKDQLLRYNKSIINKLIREM